MQARTAAAAYEQAYAMTVLPPVIAAHRTLSAALVATNIVGQNTAAIADTEAQYADFWAQNAAIATANTNSGATKVATQAFSPLSTQPQPQVPPLPQPSPRRLRRLPLLLRPRARVMATKVTMAPLTCGALRSRRADVATPNYCDSHFG